ncbi:beta-glucosidase [Novosphingobium endophyticum]|uniref:beta-glucosidase n=1 Tax=Novosphingobium endophyticum TaxID=1955250 RepID=A0A916TSW5_9SPHN|nr:glycoside hydrolase family 3 N-terminal domain-containing protein [Novosphingobium endophyticum]GGC00472.1 beta-glucosidase [Novosphingobium endophyticum]
MPKSTTSWSMAAITGVALVLGARAAAQPDSAERPPVQPELGARSAPIIMSDGLRFRDLDRNGRLTPYEDWRLTPLVRARDLVSRMTLEEKAGAMVHPALTNADQVRRFKLTSVLTRSPSAPAVIAAENNSLQQAAEDTRLGIPMTISSDPRHGMSEVEGASVLAEGFPKWPDALGFGSIGDPAVTRHFAETVAAEYRAVGITMALSPQADVATEPRWSRISGTFGEDFDTVARHSAAYIEGIQGNPRGLARGGVAAIVKHFAGYGAQDDGWDSHNYYGRYSVFPGKMLERHIAVYRPSFAAGVAGVMPTYSIIKTPDFEPVGGAFSKHLLDDLLRKREHYSGLVLSDFGVTENCTLSCITGDLSGGVGEVYGKPWGMETASKEDRFVAAINAGVDQVGGAEDGAPIVSAVRSGRLSMPRIDEAVTRIMVLKFEQGLFENPYVDLSRVSQVVGQPAFQTAALEAQQRSLVLLSNRKATLPVRPMGVKVFLRGVDPTMAAQAGFTPVETLEEADLAIMRVAAPWRSEHPGWIMGRSQHEGDLSFPPDSEALREIEAAARRVPTIVSIYLDRPAIVTPLRDKAAALIGDFGVSDQALLRAITGQSSISGRLPIELPSSMAAVEAQREDVPRDSARPLYPYGFGLRLPALAGRPPVPAEVPAWAKALAQRARQYSTATTPIADLMANPDAREILMRHLPAVVQSGNIERMGALTLGRLQGMAPQMVPDAALSAIDAELARLAPPE